MTVNDLPGLNACLNGAAAAAMTAGWILIRFGRRGAHRAAMATAVGLSALFLVTYVIHKVLVRGVHTPFGGEGPIRAVYYTMLVSHIVLAIAIVPLVLVTLNHAMRGRYERHRKWARVTFPLWYYVSVTGVLVYFFLYQWWPSAPAAG